MSQTLESSTLTITDQAELPLIADVAYQELFTSAALNRKFFGIARAGIYRGFNYTIADGLKLIVGDDSGNNTAYVERDGHCMTIQGQHPIEVTLPPEKKSAIVIEGFYQVGVVTRQVNRNADVDSAIMKVVPSAQVADHHVIVCEVDVPKGAKAITPEMISEDNRIAGGIDIHSHIDVNKDPHKQYAMRKIRINTAAPLRGGSDLAGNVNLTIDTATTERAGVVQLIDSAGSTSKVQAPTANALNYERNRALKAEKEIEQEGRAHAIAVANKAENSAKETARAEGLAAKQHASEAAEEAKEFATSEANKAKRESVAHANKVAGEAKAYASNVASAAEGRAKTHATNQASQAQKNATDAAKAEGHAAKQHADSVSATAKREAFRHADSAAKNAEHAAKAFATSEAQGAESRAKSFATTKANEAESRAKSHANALIDQLIGGASQTYDTLKEIEQALKGGDSAIGSITTQLASKLDKSATAVNSTKLEGKSKSQVVAEARNGLITESSAKNLAQSAENNAKKYGDGKYHPKSDKLARFTGSLWDTDGGQDLACRGKRALVGSDRPDLGGLIVNFGDDFGRITLVGETHASKLIGSNIELGYAHGQDHSVGCKNWFRSSGDTGWYNGTHGGGIYMKDREWVRTFGGKKFLVENTDNTSILSSGGVRANKGFFWGTQSLDDRYLKKGNLTDSMELNVAGHARLAVNAQTNKNADLYLSESDGRHGLYIRYNGAGDNTAEFGTRDYDQNEIKFMWVERGSKSATFEATPKVGKNEIYHKGNKPSPADIGAAKTYGDKNLDFNVKTLSFLSGKTDGARIATTIDGTSTNLDFWLSDDINGNDRFRFRFTPTGGTGVYSIMELYEDSNPQDKKGKVDISGQLTVTDDIYEMGETLSNRYANKNLLRDIYRNFTVEGDADTYYPVLFPSGTAAFNYMQLDISRGYRWTAPETWNSKTHKGGLTLSIRWSGDTRWGGNDHDIRVDKFDETYSSMVAGLALSTSGLVVWLRGGGAQYRMTSTHGRATQAFVHLDKLVASNKIEYLPRTDTSAVHDEVHALNWNRSGKLYDQNSRVWSNSNKPTPDDIGAYANNSTVADSEKLGGKDHSFFIFGDNKRGTSNGRADCNAINKSGFYWGSGAKNAPALVGSYLHVNHDTTDSIYGWQLWNDERTNQLFVRAKTEGNFSSWAKVYTTTDKPTPDELGAINAKQADSFAHSESVGLPKGTTEQRGDGGEGKIRFNTETKEFEGHNGEDWGSISGGGYEDDFISGTLGATYVKGNSSERIQYPSLIVTPSLQSTIEPFKDGNDRANARLKIKNAGLYQISIDADWTQKSKNRDPATARFRIYRKESQSSASHILRSSLFRGNMQDESIFLQGFQYLNPGDVIYFEMMGLVNSTECGLRGGNASHFMVKRIK